MVHRRAVEISDWAFGLVTREREPKKSFFLLRDKLGQDNAALPHRPLPSYPFVSIIVCSYNGAKTLAECLESLGRIDYPNYEVILVDDGSTDNTPEIAARFPDVRYVHQTNHGLSHARNHGARIAKGEIFAYTDSDCMADPDWLYYLLTTLLGGDYAGVGGPNVSPPAQNWVQACVAAAPGGPSHVLLTDTVAEHIPGCNMAWYRWAFENVGGFDPEYHKAGDDVDFCWRVQQAGHAIAFSPTAVVWHHRRFTLRAFRKQQEGYGEAESLLRFKHLIFFGPTGTAKWRGQIYGTPRFSWFINRPIIYHGIFGEGFFQSIYPTPQSEVAAYLGSVEWFALTVFLFGLGIFLPGLRIVPYLMFGGTLCVAISYMLRARIEPKFDTIAARLLVTFLAFAQPLVRGWSRYFTWLHFKRTPRAVISTHEQLPAGAEFTRGLRNRSYWSERRKGSTSSARVVMFRIARRRRLALLQRHRLERMGHPDLRKFLVEHHAPNRDRISRRSEMFDPRRASLPLRSHDDPVQSRVALPGDLPSIELRPPRCLAPRALFLLRPIPGQSRPPLEIARGRNG